MFYIKKIFLPSYLLYRNVFCIFTDKSYSPKEHIQQICRSKNIQTLILLCCITNTSQERYKRLWESYSRWRERAHGPRPVRAEPHEHASNELERLVYSSLPLKLPSGKFKGWTCVVIYTNICYTSFCLRLRLRSDWKKLVVCNTSWYRRNL